VHRIAAGNRSYGNLDFHGMGDNNDTLSIVAGNRSYGNLDSHGLGDNNDTFLIAVGNRSYGNSEAKKCPVRTGQSVDRFFIR
jgi:hypothetical protein